MEQKVATLDQVPVGEARRFEVGSLDICLVNLGEAGVRAIGDLCSHAQAWLHEGDVDIEDETIECPMHGSAFDLNTGAARTLPATRPVPTYAVEVQHNDILIEVR
jgi:3-phenylpropionate/trans-cinnamate dioxygenase ferredoxin subunit